MALGAIAAGALNFAGGVAGSLAGPLVGAWQAGKQRKQNKKFFNESMAFEREQFDYSKYSNQRAIDIQERHRQEDRQDFLSDRQDEWGRQDSVMQRQVADFKAAGLHPTLAAGGSAASPIMASTGQTGAGNQRPSGSAPQGDGSEMSIMDQAKFGAMIDEIMANIKLSGAQKDNVEADTNRTNQEITQNNEIFDLTIKQMLQDLDSGKINQNHVRAQIIDLASRADEAQQRLDLDRDNYHLQREVEHWNMQIMQQELTLFMYESEVIRNSGLTRYNKNNVVSQILQGLQAIESGHLQETIMSILGNAGLVGNDRVNTAANIVGFLTEGPIRRIIRQLTTRRD